MPNELGFWRGALDFLPRLRRNYGDLVRLRLVGRTVVVAFAPEHVRQVTKSNEEEITISTPSGKRLKHDVQGRGPLNASGTEHIRYREICRHSLSGQAMRSYSAIACEMTERMLASWRVGQEIDVLPEFTNLVRRIFKYFMFGEDIVGGDGAMNDAVETYVYTLGSQMRFLGASLIPFDVPGISNGATLRKRMAFIDRRVVEIESGLASTAHHSLAQSLLDTLDRRGEERESQLVRELVLQLYFAGISSVAATGVWLLLMLALHPRECDRLLNELQRTLGGSMPSPDNVLNLPVLDAALHETLRLYPAAVFEFKETASPTTLGDYQFPSGFPILLSPWVTQRDPVAFEEPNSFRPARFADGRPAYVKGAFQPWGVGYRSCVGRIVARVTIHTVVAAILQRYRLDLVPGQRIDPHTPPYTGRLLPAPGVRVRIAEQDGDTSRSKAAIRGSVVGIEPAPASER